MPPSLIRMKLPVNIRLLVALMGLLAAVLRLATEFEWAPGKATLVFCAFATVGVLGQALIKRRGWARNYGTPVEVSDKQGGGSYKVGRLLSFLLIASSVTMFFFGIRLVYVVAHSAYLARIEQTWPSTEATILKAEVRSTAQKNGLLIWAPVWTYVYSVGGRRFVAASTAIAGGYSINWYRSENLAQEMAKSRPIGQSVITFYDPDNPQQSVLDRGTSNTGINALLLAISTLMLIAGGWIPAKIVTAQYRRYRSAKR